jgi:hypothetical protein
MDADESPFGGGIFAIFLYCSNNDFGLCLGSDWDRMRWESGIGNRAMKGIGPLGNTRLTVQVYDYGVHVLSHCFRVAISNNLSHFESIIASFVLHTECIHVSVKVHTSMTIDL